MYQAHPCQALTEVFRSKPYQGAPPENAEFIFVGLDANFDAAIESGPIWERVREYLEDGVNFWRRHKVHHPFLLREYTGDGKRYHQNFKRLGFGPEDANRVSFVELLHIPTVGRSQLVAADLDSAHLNWLNSLMVSGAKRHVFLSDTVVRVMRDTLRFSWLRAPIPNAVLPVLTTHAETTIHQMLHLANYGVFQKRMSREADAIAALRSTQPTNAEAIDAPWNDEPHISVHSADSNSRSFPARPISGGLKRIFIPTRSGSDWQHLLAKPTLHWKKGQSAMSAAASWEAAGDKLPVEIPAVFDQSTVPELVNLKLLTALPEWETPLPGGTTSSCTDVMAICRNDLGLCVVAVEAKVNEPFGETLQTKKQGASAGQLERLAYLQKVLRAAEFKDNVRYQLLHRTASALLTAEDFHAGSAVMLVHAFSAIPELRSDFDVFCEAMEATKVTGDLYWVPRFDRPKLFLAWCAGDRRFAEQELPWDPQIPKVLT